MPARRRVGPVGRIKSRSGVDLQGPLAQTAVIGGASRQMADDRSSAGVAPFQGRRRHSCLRTVMSGQSGYLDTYRLSQRSSRFSGTLWVRRPGWTTRAWHGAFGSAIGADQRLPASRSRGSGGLGRRVVGPAEPRRPRGISRLAQDDRSPSRFSSVASKGVVDLAAGRGS